ncbi:PilN domain-containing protein [Candidatus Saccharibacteria bacterium]|nr:PilN domain-containing protein [Candidatus Saccharibacteria bacterium]
MIQFNLLPDIKLQYIKAKRVKRTVIVVSFLAAASAFAIFLFLFMTVQFAQKGHMSRVTDDIKTAQEDLQKIKDLDKVLTIQNQLSDLPELHDGKPASGRVFTYIAEVTPAEVSIGKTEVNFEENTISFEGTSGSLSSVNKFVDTLKFTKYQEQGSDSSSQAFSDVVLATFTVEEENGQIKYNVTLTFDPVIFDNNKSVKLIVEKGKTTTRSETEKPDELFQALPKEDIRAQ